MRDVTFSGGKMYAITEKFGYNVVSYNRAKVDAGAMRDLGTLWGDKYKGRIAVYDYYIPLMNLVALKLGMKPSDITADNLPQIKEALFQLKDNSVMVGEVVSSTTALATGEADILHGFSVGFALEAAIGGHVVAVAGSVAALAVLVTCAAEEVRREEQDDRGDGEPDQDHWKRTSAHATDG